MEGVQLLDELNKERKNIKTDSYSMSIGELISLYKDGDLNLNPAFQRVYRWDDEQKSKFIESILIGIPIPEVFVAQRKDGKWDVVDGVQRISTIVQLLGSLPDYKKLKLKGTEYLPSLEGLTWESLPIEAQRIFKRAKMGVNIILTENSTQAQYELFQRLNTGGLHLEDQEIRNCLLIMIDEKFYNEVNRLKDYKPFKFCLTISDDKIKTEYHMELIVMYFIARFGKVDFTKYNKSIDKLAYFIDKEIANVLADKSFDLQKEIELFKKTFDLLESTLGKNTFKKYNVEKRKFEGAFSIVSFEAIAVGIANNFDKQSKNKRLKEQIQKLYEQRAFVTYSGRGIKAITRFEELTKYSKEYFENEI